MGPLDGVRVIEIASLAPAPFGCMILSDLGAEVLRVDRAERCGPGAQAPLDPLSRGRRSVGINLKDPAGVELLLRLAQSADVLVEGFRPGVAERLGFGPQACAERNPRLVYGRMTGWGQDGPLAPTAGHDIDYIAISGALSLVGRAASRRSRRSTCSATSAAAACCSRSACLPRCSSGSAPGWGRWWTRPWLTGPRC